MPRWTTASAWAVRGYVGLYLLYVLLPLAVLAVYAFNTSEYLIWPPKGLTLRWFGEVLGDSRLLLAIRNSIVIAIATAVLSVVIGIAMAYTLARLRFRGKPFLEGLNYLAIVTYGVASAVGLLLWFRTLGVAGGVMPTIIGHTTFIMPFAVVVLRDRLLGFDRRLEEAAMSLGATRLRAFFDITLPLIWPSVLAAGLFCFTISLGEFLLSQFLIGNDLTLPVYIYSRLRFTFTPAVNAAATMIIAVPVLAVIVAALFFRGEATSLYGGRARGER